MKYILILIVLFFTSCSNFQGKLQNTIQSENAKQIKNEYKEIINLLILYKKKLDKRNPSNYTKNFDRILHNEILNNTNTITLPIVKSNSKKNYTQYLNYAFSKETMIKNRNDYLIVGFYKMFYHAYKMDIKHKITALSYDIVTLQNAYKNLQILQWKIKFNKDKLNQYLFLTWQNNWQIELEKQLEHNSLDNIKLSDLKNIKLKKESLLDPSNTSFEVITSKMMLLMEKSIKRLNVEPEKLSIDALISLIFII